MGTPPVGPDELRERLEPSTAPAGWPGDVVRASGRATPAPSAADEAPPRPTNRRRRPPARRSTPRSAVREPPPPWPGRLPPPSPAAVPAEPVPVELFDADGAAVRLVEPDRLSAPPALLVVDGGPAGESGAVRAWAGPWPVQQRWWAADGGAGSRLQLVCADGTGYLLTARAGRWWITGVYD